MSSPAGRPGPRAVPALVLSGHHGAIPASWRRREQHVGADVVWRASPPISCSSSGPGLLMIAGLGSRPCRVVELGRAAHEATVERVDAEAGRDAGRERGDVEGVLGGQRLLRGEGSRGSARRSARRPRGRDCAGRPAGPPRGRARRRGPPAGSASTRRRTSSAGPRAGPGRATTARRRRGATAPPASRRGRARRRRRQGRRRGRGGQAAAEVGQQEVARRVAALGVEAAEVVDVEREQERPARPAPSPRDGRRRARRAQRGARRRRRVGAGTLMPHEPSARPPRSLSQGSLRGRGAA